MATTQALQEVRALAAAGKTLPPSQLQNVGVRVPENVKQGLSMIMDTPTASRTTKNRNGEVLPGMKSLSTTMARMKISMMERIYAEFGEKTAIECSYLLSTTGFVNNPIGTIERSESPAKHSRYYRFVLMVVRRFSRRMAIDRKITHSLSVPRDSNYGAPYMATGDLGLALRLATVHSFLHNKEDIAEGLEKGDWEFLTSADLARGRLPIYPMGHQSGRAQPQKVKGIEIKNGKLVSIQKPVRQVVDAQERQRSTDASIVVGYPLTDLEKALYALIITMRARQVAAISASGNLIKQIQDHPIRCGVHEVLSAWYLSHPDEDIPNVVRKIKLRCASLADAKIATMDFSNMDHSEGGELETAYVDGLCDGGMSQAYKELALALHFGPMLTPEDDQFRRPRTPTRLDGDLIHPRDGKDRGRKSGESHTDIGNKCVGSCIYGVALYVAGAFVNLSRQLSHSGYDPYGEEAAVALADHLYDYQLRHEPHFDDRAAFIGEYGDDCAVALDPRIADAFAAALAEMEPDWHISVEDDQQLIGWAIEHNGDNVHAYHGRHISAIVSPERFWDDHMRVNGWMIGVPVNYEHYSHDDVNLRLSQILDEACIQFYGRDPRSIASAYVPNVPTVQAHSIADMQVLMDASTLQWKWSRSDLSESVLAYVDQFYYTIDEETLSLCQL